MKRRFLYIVALVLSLLMLAACAPIAPAERPVMPSEMPQSPVPVQTQPPAPTPAPSAGSEPAKDDYPFLEEFIAVINSFSDPPEMDSDKELEAYYKGLYDAWKRGEAFTNVERDAEGRPVLVDHSEDYIGVWEDSYSGRAWMTVRSDGVLYSFTVRWGDSASSTVVWELTGMYDATRGVVAYGSGQKIYETVTESGKTERETLYEDGSGCFQLRDGKLYWTDEKENAGEDCVFEKQE